MRQTQAGPDHGLAADFNFEEEFAAWNNTKHCIGVGNGLDALKLTLRAWIELGRLSPGDEVLVQGNTYISGMEDLWATSLPSKHRYA